MKRNERIESIESKILELQKEVETLKQEELEHDKGYKGYKRLENGQEYWRLGIGCVGLGVNKVTDDGCGFDSGYFNNYNYFKSQETAQQTVNSIKADLLLTQFIDWNGYGVSEEDSMNNTFEKYYVEFFNVKMELGIEICFSYLFLPNTHMFSKEEYAQEFIDNHGEEYMCLKYGV